MLANRPPPPHPVKCGYCHRNAILEVRACNAVFHREGVQKGMYVTICARSFSLFLS